MGTWLTVAVEAPSRSEALAASERTVAAVAAVEDRLSTWRADSELVRLNRAPVGRTVELSPALARDLARAGQLWQATAGAFDPGIGALVAAWDLRGAGRVPGAAELAAATAGAGLRHLTLDGVQAVRRSAGLLVDEGAFGKGVALDEAAAAARAAGATCVHLDLGGQQLLAGRCRSLAVAVADPRDRTHALLETELASGSLATSGNSERGRRADGVAIGHILDPRDGRPARDFGSVTVWAPDATTADALSTALFVMGPEDGMEWQRSHGGCEVVYLVGSGRELRVLTSSGARGRLGGQPAASPTAIDQRSHRSQATPPARGRGEGGT